jgi:hypothetical protein
VAAEGAWRLALTVATPALDAPDGNCGCAPIWMCAFARLGVAAERLSGFCVTTSFVCMGHLNESWVEVEFLDDPQIDERLVYFRQAGTVGEAVPRRGDIDTTRIVARLTVKAIKGRAVALICSALH